MKNTAIFSAVRRPSRWASGLLAALLAGCLLVLAPQPAGAEPARSNPAPLSVAATILPLGDFCRQLGGDLVDVQVLIPPGASPHAFEPAPSMILKAHRARVFVYIGAGLEPWAQRFLAARGRKNLVVVEAAQGLPLIREVAEQHGEAHQEEAHGHHHGAGNPHIWLDPVLSQDICRKIAGALSAADPAHRDRYEANLAGYLKALDELDREIRSRVAQWRTRSFISFHPAFAYFARRYGLKEAGVLEPAPGREPTPRHLQEIVKSIKELGLKVVFAEPQLNPRVAETVAREAGVQVLVLDPIGGSPPYGSDYLRLMRHNLAVMEEAMK